MKQLERGIVELAALHDANAREAAEQKAAVQLGARQLRRVERYLADD